MKNMFWDQPDSSWLVFVCQDPSGFIETARAYTDTYLQALYTYLRNIWIKQKNKAHCIQGKEAFQEKANQEKKVCRDVTI